MKKSLFILTAAIILIAAFAACAPEIITLPAGVTLDQSSVTLSPGQSLKLTAEVFPEEVANTTIHTIKQ